MSFYVSASKGDKTLKSVRVGTNCSQYALVALFLAAYGVAGMDESRRVRAGWITPQWRGLQSEKVDESTFPTRSFVPFDTIRDWKAWIGFNHNNCTWVQMENETIERGVTIKPVTDHSLSLLVKFRAECLKGKECGTMEGQDVADMAVLLRFLMPHLATSSWAETLEEVTQVFEVAATEEGIVIMG